MTLGIGQARLSRLANKTSALALALLLAGSGLSVAGALWVRDRLHHEATVRFDNAVDRVEAEVLRRFKLPLYGLRGLASDYAAHGDLSAAQFHTHVSARELAREFPGVHGFGFIQAVPRRDLDRFVAAERANGLPGFSIRTLDTADRDELFVIKRIEPLAQNRAALGLDVGSEAARRDAVERAVRTGQAQLTAPIALVQDGQKTPGFLLCVPVFQRGLPPANTAERRAALLGVLYAPIIASELLQGSTEAATHLVSFQLFFGQTGMPGQPLVFDASQAGAAAAAGRGPAGAGTGPRFTTTRNIDIAGSAFTLQMGSTARLEAGIDRLTPTLILAGGLLLSALLSVLSCVGARGRQRAEALAQRMTVELDRLAVVARYSANAVVFTDLDQRIHWVNDTFTHLYGHSREQALGQTLATLVGSPLSDPAALRVLQQAHRSGTSCRVDLVNRSADGRHVWVDVELQPVHDAAGALSGFVEVMRDDTERRAVAQRLARLAHDNEALLDTIRTHTIVSITSPDGTIIEVNDAFCRLSGYRRDELLGQNHRLLNSGTQAAAFWPGVWRQLVAGKAWRGQVCNRAKDGSLYWVDSVIAPFLGPDGQIERYVSLRIDITRQHTLENDLRRHNALMATVLEHLPCGLSVFDEQLELVASNREYRRLLDFPDNLFSGQPRFEDFIRFNVRRGEYGDGDVETQVQALLQRARGPALAHRFERTRPDGTPLEVQGTPMPGGGFVTTYTDISARRRAEQEVQRSGALLRGALEAIDEGFVLYDPDDRLVFCNDKYREIYASVADLMVPGARFEDIVRAGVERGDYLGAIGRVDHWMAERLAAHRRADSTLVQALANGRTLRIIERRLPDGHIVGFRIDVSELTNAVAAAQAASRSKSQFLANMSHEIRTPMNAILGMLTLLRRSRLDPRQADHAAKAEGAARSMLGLLNDILDFSKVDAGKMSLEARPFRVDRLLRDLSVILSAAAAGKHVELLFDIDPALPRALVGDAMRLQQVLTNLAGNAIKFTEQGNVVLSARVVGQDPASVTLDLAVQDDGIGIAPENQARIFSGFTQAEASTTRRFGGTGLGLAISQQLVGLMGGELRLDSALGQGSRFHFRITLPLAPQAPLAPQTTPDPTTPSGVAVDGELVTPSARRRLIDLRVLVVDDNPVARALHHGMLDTLGWTVDVADSGATALQLMAGRQNAYDAVFIDGQMPGMDGWQTCQNIRSLPMAGPPPLLVIVTGHGQDAPTGQRSAQRGLIDAFLVKPVTVSMLHDAVVDASARRHAPAAPRDKPQAASRRLAGLRLLLVEDNANNQQVARELLEDEGATVQIAGNGQQAVEAVGAEGAAFDVVLMDLQMPVMDGYTATRHIRRDLARPDLPIIAMTANAMPSDRDACLAAGMNDHVGKPFDLDDLVRVLLRHAGRKTSTAATKPGSAAASLPEAVTQAAQAAGVDVHAALHRLGGNTAVYQRLLDSFVVDLAAMPALLQAQLAAGDPLPTLQLMHTLKGLAATLGAGALSAQAAEAERHIAAGLLPAEAAALAKRTGETLVAAGPGLAALQAAWRAAAPASTDPAAPVDDLLDGSMLLPWLQALAGQLRNADMAATQTMAAIRGRVVGALATRLQALDDAVEGIDFEQALRHCDALLQSLATPSSPAHPRPHHHPEALS